MRQDLESLIFCSPEPVGMDDLLGCMRKLHGPEITPWMVEEVLEEIMAHYRQGPYPFEVVNLAGGYRFLTKPECRQAVELHLKEQARRKLSASALETLSIIAYRQPITKAEVEQVRGVNCDYAILKLLERNLVAITGRKEAPGRPVIYQTTPRFLEHIGVSSLADLPPVRTEDVEEILNEVGT